MACFGTGRKAKPCKEYPEFGCADGVWRMQCRIVEEDEGFDRKVRDFLKVARAFLLRIWPAMSIAEAARHPLINGTQMIIFLNF